ncbi:MAG: sugar phosphate isomerase/epimerase family protein [Casimicrobiaceae bacterium]
MSAPSRRLSLAALTVIELAPPEMVSVAAAAGYQHVGLRLIPATPDDRSYAVIGDTPMVREIKVRLADTGLSVLDVEVFRLRPDTDVQAFLPAIETAAALGARHLLTTGQDPDSRRLRDRFAQLCDVAAAFGLTADLEFMPWTEISGLDEALRLLADANRANAGLVIDSLHFDRAAARLQDLAAVPPRCLHFMQLCDAPAARPKTTEELIFQARSARLVPGRGELALIGLLRSLPADLPISLEVPDAAAIGRVPALERARAAIAATRALLERAHALPVQA